MLYKNTNFLDVITFQNDMLQCANDARPFVDFLIDVNKLLLSLSGADAIENLLKKSGRFSRWEMQRERVKELTCLYRIGRATSATGAEIDAILQRIVECLPPA